MKVYLLIASISFSCLLPAQSPTGTVIRGGVVPYQLFSRSCGFYFGFQKENFSLEYRPTYTFSQEWSAIENFTNGADLTSYHGINNNFLLDFNNANHFRFLLIQRSWWYNNKYLPVDNVPSSKNQDLRTDVSAFIIGGGAGVEIYWDFSNTYRDLRLYIDLSLSYLKGKRTISDNKFISYYSVPKSYERTMILGNFTIGLQLGSRKTKTVTTPSE